MILILTIIVWLINYISDFNIYEVIVPDRMHLLDLGISKYLLEFTWTYIQQKVGMITIKKMDLWLHIIFQYQELVIIKNNLENILWFTANDYCNIMKMIIFIIDNLFVEYKDGGVPCERLCEIFCKYMEIYIKTHQESFTDDDLTKLEIS